MTKLIADNFMTQMKIKKIPVDIREQIYFEIIDEQVKKNNTDLINELNGQICIHVGPLENNKRLNVGVWTNRTFYNKVKHLY